MNAYRAIGIFGGTFDPVHFGHLRTSLEIQQQLKLDEMRLIPCKHPPHRPPPTASALHRLNMARLGVENSELIVDDREMTRDGPSYSIDTLMSLRREFPRASLNMVVRQDAFLELPSWYQWEKLIQLANIIVICNIDWSMPKAGIMTDFFEAHALAPEESPKDFTAGRVMPLSVTALDIAARKLRALMQAKRSIRFLVPEKVLDYIQKNDLYGYNEGSF